MAGAATSRRQVFAFLHRPLKFLGGSQLLLGNGGLSHFWHSASGAASYKEVTAQRTVSASAKMLE
jgi:hypothetical protein